MEHTWIWDGACLHNLACCHMHICSLETEHFLDTDICSQIHFKNMQYLFIGGKQEGLGDANLHTTSKSPFFKATISSSSNL